MMPESPPNLSASVSYPVASTNWRNWPIVTSVAPIASGVLITT